MGNEQIISRIRKYLQEKQVSASAFAKTINFNQSNLSKILRGERAVPANLIEAITENTNIRREWLVKGEGEMLNQSDVSVAPKAEDGTLLSTNPHGIKYYKVGGKLMAKVPLMKFSAFGSAPDDWGTLTADRDDVETIMVEVDRMSRGNYVVFSVDNDSMDDGSRRSFEPGDQIFVRELDRSDWLPRLRFDKWPFWVVAFGNNIRLKQITAQDEQGNITCHSLNPSPEFTDFTLPLDSISHLYNVIRKIPKTIDYERP